MISKIGVAHVVGERAKAVERQCPYRHQISTPEKKGIRCAHNVVCGVEESIAPWFPKDKIKK